jgi:hypothetical protein
MAINCGQRIAGVSQVVEVEVGTQSPRAPADPVSLSDASKSGTHQVLEPGEPFALRRLQS